MRVSVSLLIVTALAATVGHGAELVEIWADYFDGNSIDESKWTYNTGCDGFGNNELQCYVANRRENARVENGNLILQARHENWENRVFTSAKLTSKASWTYGLYEVRARLPKGKHLWPAVWMMPQDSAYGGWPRSGELDIMEYRGQRPQQIQGTAHFGRAWNDKSQVGSGERDFPNDFGNEWHTFGFNWDPWSLTWILDGNTYHTESIDRILGYPDVYTANGQPFDKNFYYILNLAVGGNFFGGEPFDPSEADHWERNMIEIDFVRVSKWI